MDVYILVMIQHMIKQGAYASRVGAQQISPTGVCSRVECGGADMVLPIIKGSRITVDLLQHSTWFPRIIFTEQNSKQAMDPSTEPFSRPAGFRRPNASDPDLLTSDSGSFAATMEMMQVINAQNMLIMKLLHQQNILYKQLSTKSSGSDSASNSFEKKHENNKMSGYKEIAQKRFSSSSNPEENEQFSHHVKIVHQGQPSRKMMEMQQNRHFQDESANSQGEMGEFYEVKEGSKFGEKKKQTETKNMIKNFSKAIFSYIRKNRARVEGVVAHLGLNEQEFMLAVEKHKGHIHSIAELRELWTQQDAVGKAFRILSQQYLRKHCLAKTFNSRIENYNLHLKYRQRLLEGLEQPQDFTVLKTN